MTLVPNQGVYCVLACLESLLADLGRRQSWQQIRDLFEPRGFCNSAGVVWTIKAFREGCTLLNLCTETPSVQFPIPELYKDGSLFIFFTTGALHCVRFFDQREEHKALVMDPDYVRNHNSLRWMDEPEFSSVGSQCIRVTMGIASQAAKNRESNAASKLDQQVNPKSIEIDFRRRETETGWQRIIDRFGLAAAPNWFKWLEWVLVLAAFQYLADKTKSRLATLIPAVSISTGGTTPALPGFNASSVAFLTQIT